MSTRTTTTAIGSQPGEIVAEVIDRCALALTALGLDEHTTRRGLAELVGYPPDQPRAAPPELTGRQREVLHLLADGLTVRAIARRLRLSPRTVGKHLEHVYRRLGTSDRLTTVLRAQRHGLLCPAQEVRLQSVHRRRG